MPLASDFEFVQGLINPLLYQTSDTLATFAFRIGMMQGRYSEGAAVWLIQFVFQLVCALAAYALLRGGLIKDLFSSFERPRIRAANGGLSWVGAAVAIVCAAVVLVPLYVLFFVPATSPTESGTTAWDVLLRPSLLAYAFGFWFATFVHMLMTIALAYPLTVRRLPGRGLYKLFLIVALLAGTGTIHEYLTFKNYGVIDTTWAIMVGGFVSIVPVFVLKSIFNAKYAQLKEQAENEGRGEMKSFFLLFVPKVWKAWIALGVLHLAAQTWGYQLSLLYMNDANRFSPAHLFMQLTVGGAGQLFPPGDPLPLAVGALISLPAVVLFLLFRPWMTSEVLVSQIRRG